MRYRFLRHNIGIILWCTTAVAFQAGCRKKVKKAAPKLEVTTATSETEERNLRALCAAAAEVRKQPGVQDRLARIAEIAAPTSATTELLDGLIALEGPKRLSVVKALVAKYGLRLECRAGIPAFEVANEAPPPNAPTPPAQVGTAQNVAPPSQTAESNPTVVANSDASGEEGELGYRGAPPIFMPGQEPDSSATPTSVVPKRAAKAAYGGFRGLGIPNVAAPAAAATLVTTPTPRQVTRTPDRQGRPTLALPAGRSFAFSAPRNRVADGGVRGLAPPTNTALDASRKRSVSTYGMEGVKGMAVPVPVGAQGRFSDAARTAAPAAGLQPKFKAGGSRVDGVSNQRTGSRFAPGGIRADGKTGSTVPRFAPGGTRAD
ncbi:MAG: hypothetical protein VX223_00920 [Myxococcota bacterium]|nr:hypothetical protein [Myxococcota bacterium]